MMGGRRKIDNETMSLVEQTSRKHPGSHEQDEGETGGRKWVEQALFQSRRREINNS